MRRATVLTLSVIALAASCWADIPSPVGSVGGSSAIAGAVLSASAAAAGVLLARRKRARLARAIWILAAALALLAVLGFFSGRDRDRNRYHGRPVPEPVPQPVPR